MLEKVISLILLPINLLVELVQYAVKKVIGLVVLLYNVLYSILEALINGFLSIVGYLLDTINEIYAKGTVLIRKK